MATMKSNLGARAKSLAILWGQHFGNTDFGYTLGVMKTLLRGNAEKGLSAYRYHDIRGCIEWLAEEQKAGNLEKPVEGPGAIKWVIKEYIADEDISQTFLGYKEPIRKVKIL